MTRGLYVRGHRPVKLPFRPCACGCGELSRGEYVIGHRGASWGNPCACGCGKRSNGEYVQGHRPTISCARCEQPFVSRPSRADPNADLTLCVRCRKRSKGSPFKSGQSESRQMAKLAPEGRHWCLGCKRFRALKFFPTSGGGYCKPCKRHKHHEYVVQKTYGITIAQYEAIKELQGGRCAICQIASGASKHLAVDHDHKCCAGETSCGKCVRGLLCSRCNQGLGFARDNIEHFQRAIDYLLNPPAHAVTARQRMTTSEQ